MELNADIELLLSKRNLYAALQQMKPLAIETSDFRMTDRLQSLEQNYSYLIDYFSSGKDDPERQYVFNRLTAETFILLDDINALNKSSSQLLKDMKSKAIAYSPTENKYSVLKHLFYRAWLGSETEIFKNLSDSWQCCMYVSGLALNITESFNEKKLTYLCKLAKEYSGVEKQRALVSLILLAHIYDKRLTFFPDIITEIKTLISDNEVREMMLYLYRLLIETTLTPLVNKEMDSLSKDILPEIKHSDNMFVALDEIDEENPKWGNEMRNSFNKHINAMTKLHEEGADINYASTRGILTDGFFHNDIANWFIPFGHDNPELSIDFSSDSGKLLQGILAANTDSCDTDKYALCCIYKHIQQQLSNKRMPTIMDDMIKFGEKHKHIYDNRRQALDYVRMLYRFYMHNPWQFENIMDDIGSITCDLLFNMVYKDEEKSAFGDRCLSLTLYQSAISMYNKKNVIDLQKRGYALQKLSRYSDALEVFEKALKLEEDYWTMKHAAFCLRQLGMTKEALEMYDRIHATSKKNDKTILLMKAKCLLDLKRAEDALNVFYQLDLLYPGDINIQRGLAWCAFLTADSSNNGYNVAEQYMEQAVYSDEATAGDYVNYGHLLLTIGQRKEAIETYLRALNTSNGKAVFLKQMLQDLPVLQNKGLDSAYITLVIDSVLMQSVKHKEE